MLKGFTDRLRSQTGTMLAVLFLHVVFCNSLLLAQQPQASSDVPLFNANAKYVQGIGPGYWPTTVSGLTLNLSSGTAVCSNVVQTYPGGTLGMTANATNYVFLDASNSCLPASNTTGFTDNSIPIAQVTTSSSSITNITDVRTWFLWRPAGTSGGGTGSSGAVDATQFPGADAGQKIAAAVASLPSVGGTVDARGLTGTQAFSATVAIPAKVTLLLGASTVTAAVFPVFTVSNDSAIVGLGMNGVTKIITNLTNGSAISSGTGANGVVIQNLYLENTSASNAGAVAITVNGLKWHISNLSIHNYETGLNVANGGGAYWNEFENISILTVGTGVHYGTIANSNVWIGGVVSNCSSKGFYIEGGANAFYHTDVEGATACIGVHLASTATYNRFESPYFESDLLAFQVDGNYNSISNPLMQTIGTNPAITNNVGDELYLTSSKYPNYNSRTTKLKFQSFGGSTSNVLKSNSGLVQVWNGSEGQIVPLESGGLRNYGGVYGNGRTSITTLATPSAPTMQVHGTPGSQSINYYVVCRDYTNNGMTPPSAAGNISNAPDTLDSNNYVIITVPNQNGCWRWDILKNDTGHQLGSVGVGSSLNDTGQATTAYTPPTRNSTADLSVAGSITGASYATAAACITTGTNCSYNTVGLVTINAATTSKTISTTAVTANSQILLTFDESLGPALGTTCNTDTASESARYFISARTPGTNFTIKTNTAPTTNPACLSFVILN